jgi:uncharacterized repeat protein (TIGR03803 family)
MRTQIWRSARLATVVASTVAVLFATSAMAASFQVLHSFAGPEGQTPVTPLVQGTDGFLYGVAAHGGDPAILPPDGGGTAFRVDASGGVNTLHTFKGPDGAVPNSLIQAGDGFLYGTTVYGGGPAISSLQPGYGTIFRMNTAGTLTTLHVFPANDAAAHPRPIIQGADRALYGTMSGGVGAQGHRPGFVYRFDPVSGNFRHLHDFVISDGANPTGPLFQATDGFFYGTTNEGGKWNSGVIYKVDALGNFVLLHSLSPLFPGEGSQPKGGVIQASDGSFYGTTEQGGYGGEIFRMDAAGTFTVLHSFDAYASDGWRPVSGLIQGRDGFLYGTAPIGGLPVTASSRRGVVYRMDLAGTVTVLRTFTGPDGASPQAALVQGTNGRLYGSTVIGGASGLGVLFAVDLASAPPPVKADTVAVTLAQYRASKKLFSVGATSTSATATLTAYVTSTGTRIGTLANVGGGKFSAVFSWPSKPQSVTVRSSMGGSATKTVTTK